MNQAKTAPYPRARITWYMVILLTLAYIFSYIDRIILGLLVDPIQKDLGVSDAQMGYLLGPAFGIFYATMGLPLGWLADRMRRVTIVTCGIAIWSAATAFCGLAQSYVHLFLMRMTVGVGEATLSPCSMSMIADSFPVERRGRAIAVYSTALSLGAFIAYLLGGLVLDLMETADKVVFPIIGEIRPWQGVFIVVGLPGLLLALLIMGVREPARRDLKKGDSSKLRDMLKYVGARPLTFITFMLPFCLMTTIAYAHFWLPSSWMRTFSWETTDFAYVKAFVTLAAAPGTVLIAGALSDRFVGRKRTDAPLVIALVGVLIMVPSGILIFVMPNSTLAFAMLGIHLVGIATTTATGVTALLMITPAQFRGQIVAIYYMCISITGLMLGPTTVGVLSDLFSKGAIGIDFIDGIFQSLMPTPLGDQGLAYAFTAVPLIYGIPVVALAPITLRLFRRELARVEQDA